MSNLMDFTVYLGDNVKLYLGDCLEIMPNLETGSIDMILCDLPYGTTACKWDTIIPFDKLWEQYERIIKPNGAIVLFGSEPFSSYLRMSNIKNYRYDWIWNKNKGANPLLSNRMPMKSHETISIFYKKLPLYNPQFTEGKPYKAPRTGGTITNNFIKSNEKASFKQKDNNGKRHPLTIIDFSIHCGSKIHPTQKPVALFEYLIKTYTNKGDTVLDNCIGSGTTAVACGNLERNCIGIEKDETYYNSAVKRINDIWAMKLNKQVDELF